ncbi:MAG: ParB/RepB/Spo0J family partition protein [Chloroflexi bacterium]|nr:ParB/RepB/Spo0J family partition protein [Chloroflexota bacterium]MDA1145944.1 ParB/RepB/Spo0J family partition protein [Chloroflexota bacterium]
MARKGGLGRGLAALIPERPQEADPAEAPATAAPTSAVSIDAIVPNPQQPRTIMREDELAELAASIHEHGIIQPLLVSEQRDDDGTLSYQLIAGERRWRAARAAGLTEVPVTIRQTTPQELLELAIIENVQRADLSPLEEATAYHRLMNDFSLTQQQVAQRVGRSRTAVANTVRLLDLPPVISASLAQREISEGHGRALLGSPSVELMLEAWGQVIADSLNVRQTEELVRAQREPAPAIEPANEAASAANLEQAIVSVADPGARGPAVVTEGIAAALQRALGTKVTLRRTPDGNGSMTIHFYSDEELDGILERLIGDEQL